MRQRDGVRPEQQSKVNMNAHRDHATAAGRSSHADPLQQHEASSHKKVRKGIVSVNGRDVGEMHCTGGKHV
jgi:hypothetical protein